MLRVRRPALSFSATSPAPGAPSRSVAQALLPALIVALLLLLPAGGGAGARAGTRPETGGRIPAFAQAVAEAAMGRDDIAAFYRDRAYAPIWTGAGEADRARRAALLAALSRAGDHGLPVARYGLDGLIERMRAVRSPRQRGALEVELSELFVTYANQVHAGVVRPAAIDPTIVRKPPRIEPRALLDAFAAAGDPAAYLTSLEPTAPEYARLMKEKLRLERVISHGGWGPQVTARKLEPGQQGGAVVALRNRLVAMGYLGRRASARYDAAMEGAVRAFQADHGLVADGVAGAGTIRQINVPARQRLASIMVAMEREKWTNFERGKRHVWVNLTDFSASIVDDGKVTFATRAVVGKNTPDRRTPEFSDVMEYMEVNPYWNVPRSIAVKEYLPSMQKNPNAAGHLQLMRGGKVVSREGIDFSQYTAKTFPFDLRQAPSARNALGIVKFMFPNPYNIYLHDTPAKSLFQRETRAFSHGCIRLQQPRQFAYALLAPQTDDPVGVFQRALRSGKNTRIDIVPPVPVHLVYRTAVMPARGKANYRRDVYGRDARIFEALRAAGVEFPAFDS